MRGVLAVIFGMLMASEVAVSCEPSVTVITNVRLFSVLPVLLLMLALVIILRDVAHRILWCILPPLCLPPTQLSYSSMYVSGLWENLGEYDMLLE